MKPIRTKAIVLRRTNYAEADRILQLLTPEHGKLSVIAKGVRREKSKLAGGIELFAICDVSIIPGKGDMGTLTSSRLDTFYGHIMEEYDRLQLGYEAIKQVNQAAEVVSDPAFFELLATTFASLDNHEIHEKITAAWFWLQLAILLGVGLNLSTDENGMKLVEESRYNFSEDSMSFIYHEQGRFTTEHIKLLRLLSAQPPHVAQHVQGVESLIGECLWLAERSVAH
jgi:DNA repair protein RecO (recombination protein O)